MLKLGRNYILTVSTSSGGTVIIEPPFTLEFDISRTIFGSANGSSIRIFNLSQKNREQIRKNRWDRSDDRPVSLFAGYGQNLSKIFSGFITEAWSVREDVDFITQIQSFDAGFAFANAEVAQAYPAGTPQASIIQGLLDALPGVTPGAVGSYPGTTSRGSSYTGNPVALLSELSGGGFFVDNGVGHVLGNNEALTGVLPIITSDSGLLGTPLREEAYLNFDMIFEPRLIIGQQVQLESSTGPKESRSAPNFNALYKVVGLHHRGRISPVSCGQATTSVQLFCPPTLVTVTAATGVSAGVIAGQA